MCIFKIWVVKMVSMPSICNERYKNHSGHFKPLIPLLLRNHGFSDIGEQNISPSLIQQPMADVTPSESHEGIMRNYFNKLKNLLANPFSQAALGKNNATKMDKLYRKHPLRGSHQRTSLLVAPSRYTVRNLPRPRKAELHAEVYSVIRTAIEDGFANKTLKRKRNQFILKNLRPSGFYRAATNGPSRYCGECYMMGVSWTGIGSLLKEKSKKLPKQGKRKSARTGKPDT